MTRASSSTNWVILSLFYDSFYTPGLRRAQPSRGRTNSYPKINNLQGNRLVPQSFSKGGRFSRKNYSEITFWDNYSFPARKRKNQISLGILYFNYLDIHQDYHFANSKNVYTFHQVCISFPSLIFL